MSETPHCAGEPLEAWIAREHAHAGAQMLRSVSPTELVKVRPGFAQTVQAHRGSIVASPVLAAYDPDPDYFFHWYRDSAVVIDALAVLFELAALHERSGGSPVSEPREEPRSRDREPACAGSQRLLEHFAEFVRFSLALRELDGRALSASPAWRGKIRDDFLRFVRPASELDAVHGEAAAADTRVNPDGTIDISRWARPQHDGPALRALAVLRWMRRTALEPPLRAAAARLLRADLAFVRHRARTPCFDIWEEEEGLHYYTLCVSAAALDEAARWLAGQAEIEEAELCRREAAALYESLDGYWLESEGYYRSRTLSTGARSAKELDIAVVLAAIHGASDRQRHSPRDPRIRATLARLAGLFEAEYGINRERPPSRAPALGRYPNDVYYSGGAYYFSTLGAAELCYRAAACAAGEERRALAREGDAFLETVRAFTPPSGDLSEQFDRSTGVQTSAKHLAWSYAAFISAIAARDALT